MNNMDQDNKIKDGQIVIVAKTTKDGKLDKRFKPQRWLVDSITVGTNVCSEPTKLVLLRYPAI